jgi:hypothetical protein
MSPGTLGERCFVFEGRLPGFDVLVSDAFGTGSDRVDCEFVENSKYACGDAVANARQMAQALTRYGGWLRRIAVTSS